MTTTYNRRAAVDIIRKAPLSNPGAAFDAAVEVGLDLPAACALLQKESGGRNTYGSDHGGALAGYLGTVDASNYAVFRWLISTGEFGANGVGPCQITSTGLLDKMEAEGLNPWIPLFNMQFGFGLLKGYHDAAVAPDEPHPWVVAGTRYNGALSYGEDFAAKRSQWVKDLKSAAA